MRTISEEGHRLYRVAVPGFSAMEAVNTGARITEVRRIKGDRMLLTNVTAINGGQRNIYALHTPNAATGTLAAASAGLIWSFNSTSPYVTTALSPHLALQPLIIHNENPIYTRTVDLKRYELTDHLGNVRAVVSDRLLADYDVTTNADPTNLRARVLGRSDYYPFGSLMPGRNYSSDSYRFGFGGMPKDDEVHGSTGTSLDFGARLYDPRVGRWLSLDPLAAQAPGKSPYAYVSNNPISRVDKDGKIDFQYTVSYRCNADKTYTKVIKATAIYYVVNVSTSPYFDAGNIPSERSQDWKATISPKNVVHPDGTQITSVEFDLRFETRNLDPASYSKLPQNANVHFIVDEVENSAKHGDMAGAGTFEGQAIVSELGDVRRRTHVTHERGHNFGFLFERNPMGGDDPHHSADKSNVMSYGGGGEFPLAAMQQWLQTSGILGGQPEGTYSYGSGKAQADGIGLLKDKATKYDATKYDKVTR